MRKFLIIFKYEFLKQVQTKAFKAVTLVLVIVAVTGSFFMTRAFIDTDQAGDLEPEPIGIYLNGDYLDYAKEISKTGIYEVVIFESEESLKTGIIEEGFDGIVINDYSDIDIYVASTSITSSPNQLISILDHIYKNKLLQDKGLILEDIVEVQSSQVDVEIINLGLDGFLGYGYTYVFTMLLYMSVVMYGSVISSSIVSEKTSKAMELLITSAKPTSLVAGKVIGVGLASVIQIVTAIASLFISLNLFSLNGPKNPIFELLANIPLGIVLLAIFLYIVGFFSILFLFAGFSSFAAKPEDATVVITPLMMIIVGIFFIVIFGMTADLLDHIIIVVLSFIPIFSPFLLFARYALYGLTNLEIVLGVVSNLLGAILLIYVAAKIYRGGTLYYGNTIRFSKIFKSILK
ncbi:MAG: ABC transporter permease [Erysipelothrix sp.]|nr:ABC transporter permease [Erysipelothrix sp.]